MNKVIVVFVMFLSFSTFSQIGEGQKFCEETKDGSYFPVQSFNFNKKVLWSQNFYKETKAGIKIFNGESYTIFKQEWDNNQSAVLYLREEKGVVFQYEPDLKKETVRYDPNFKKGDVWKGADGKDLYKIITYEGEFKTPYCKYKNVLIIEASVSYGQFYFYYLKGHGYIGATKDGKLISCVSPE